MTYRLDRYDTQAELDAVLAAMPTFAASTAMQVTAYVQVVVYSEPDPETGEVPVVAPAMLADGYWLLSADPDAPSPLVLPEGVVAVSPLFAGMAEPVSASTLPNCVIASR